AALRAEFAVKRKALVALCEKYAVSSLDLFGSGTTEAWQPSSDLDFVVTFKGHSTSGLADRYLGLAEELEKLFGRRVELITPGAIRNPYFKRSVDASRASVYAE
ncbi:MAG: nucleotidyltransferase family protein, partial [Gemmatimonadaceae bacterium]